MKKHLRPIKMCNYPTLSSKISLETEFASNDTFGDRFGYSKGINHIHSRVIKICRKMLNFTQQEVIKLLHDACVRHLQIFFSRSLQILCQTPKSWILHHTTSLV